MGDQTHKKLGTRRFILGGILLLASFTVFAGANGAVSLHVENHIQQVAQDVDDGLRTDQEYLLKQARELDDSRTFDRHIRSGDIAQLLSTAISERDARGLDGLLITNANGLVLTRSKAVQQRGDFIYHTTTWGRELAKGNEVASVEAGAAFPLDVLGAVPMEREDGLLGSIVPAYIVDDRYATRFSETYLPPAAELAFHVTGKGIVGHSFQNSKYGRTLSFYFSEGIDALNGTGTVARVGFNGDQYFVSNLALSGIDGSPGNILTFVPALTKLEQAVAGLAVSLVFLSFFVLVSPHVTRRLHIKSLATYAVGVFGTVLFFGLGFTLYGAHVEERVVQLTQPTYAIYNSTLELDPPVAALNQQSEYRVGIRLFSGGESINATEVQLAFDPSKVQITEVDFSRSWCNQNLIIQREIDNENGTVTVVCGVPNPGFSERSGIVADVFVQPIQKGRFELSFTERTQVLANDGLGTQVLRYAVNGSYMVVEQIDIGEDALLHEVLTFSPTHPNPERWYNTRDILFTWTQFDTREQRYSFSTALEQPSGDMRAVSGATIELNADEDGTHYFYLESDTDEGETELSTLEVNIDTEPPRAPTVRVSNNAPRAGELVRFQFSGEDALSGLQSNFYLKFNDGIFFPVGETFSTAFFEPGEHTITVRSFDRANNFNETTVTISVQSPLMAALGSLDLWSQ